MCVSISTWESKNDDKMNVFSSSYYYDCMIIEWNIKSFQMTEWCEFGLLYEKISFINFQFEI